MSALPPRAARPFTLDRAGSTADDPLARAFDDERAIIDDLHATLLRQRSAVATDDLDEINATVFAAHRLLGAHREARLNRRRAVDTACQRDGATLDDLDEAVGLRLSDRAREAREQLRASAQRLHESVAVNRELLQAAMIAGDTLMRLLARTQPGAPAGYQGDAGAGGRLLHVTG